MIGSFVRRVAMLGTVVAVGALSACSDDTTEPTPLAVPAAPTVSSTLTPAPSATVTWTAASQATSYLVQRATGATAGTFVQVGDPMTTTTFTDNTVAASTTYRYRVASRRGNETSDYGADAPVTIGTPGPKTRKVAANITTSQTWFSDTVYTLSGYVKVQSGATLTIQAGTTIVGDTTVAGSSLWILRGAKIQASGTAAAPIVFTSARSAGNRKPGDWGGLIIIGNGIINRTNNPITTEGANAGQAENYAGGTDNNDNSGTLRYVRIEFAGYDVSNGNGQELNSLSSYAVGRGTTYEYLETMSGLDDSYEWWGGAVDGRYLVSYESGDDHFDWTEGYVGRNQFMLALQTQRLIPLTGAGVFSSDPRGFEGDGCDPVAGSGCIVTSTSTSTPYSMPVFANFTMVGTGSIAGFPADGNGMVLRRGTGGTFRNGVLARWRGIALNMRDFWTDSLRLRDSLSIRGLVLAENGFPFDTLAANNINNLATADKFTNNNIRALNVAAASLFNSINPSGLDWRPAGGATSALATGGETAPAARVANYFTNTWVNTTYVGAVDPAATALWYSGWTKYSIN